jgi:hypothetical protein
VSYREKNADSEWYKLVTPRENLTLSNLKPNAVYEYTVGASCEVGKYTHSTIKEFTTLVKDEIAFQGCGIQPDPKDLANKNPLPELFPNDVVTAGDFPIVVLHSTGSNGTFTGDGYVTLPFLEKFRKLIDAADALGGEKINIGQFSRIKITFKDIGVNTDFKLISGEIVASYDKDNWDKMLDVDKITNDIAGSNGKPIEGKLAYEVKEDGITLNPDGSTTIKGTNGELTTLPKSVYDQVYIDKSGDVVNIPANGSGAPTFIKSAEGGRAVAANTNGISSSGEVTQISSSDVSVTFEDGPKALYAFDELPDSGSEKLKATYETIKTKDGNVYNVNYKAVSDLNGPDILIAEADFENGKTKDDIVFKTNTGASVDVKWTSNTKAEIKLKRTLNFSKESIIATVKGAKEKDPKDAAKTIDGKSDIAGKVNIWQLTQKPVINITLVSVNGASTPDVSKAKEFLNDVYNKVGIKFDVTTQDVTIETLPNEIQCGESGVFDVYTNDQNNIISQIESSTDFKYNDKTYYVIYTGKSGEKNYKGFMPLGKQYAFVFNNGNLKTAAHELGHGIFGLKHPFETEAESGKTDLLMDYDEEGIRLSHNDWDIIHSGGWKFYGFQKSSSGASKWVVLDDKFLNLDKDPKDNTKGSFSFLSYHGEIITIQKSNLEQILFNYGTTDYQSNGKQAPGVLQSFVINKNGTRTLYQINVNDGKYKDGKGISYEFPVIKAEIIDGVVVFVPCGADGKTYKFKKSNLRTYSNANAKGDITAIDEFPFIPFSANNQALETAGVKMSQSFELTDEGLRWSYDQNTVDMTKGHCEKPELFYILKIAQIRKNYPEAFDKFTDINNWENPKNITDNAGPSQGGTTIKKAFEWTYILNRSENAKLKSDYSNNINLENYFKKMYQEFTAFIQAENVESDLFWIEIDKKTELEILSQIQKESIVELEKRTPEQKSTAIKVLINGIVREDKEDAIIKLIASFKQDEISKLENLLINNIGLKTLDSKFDNFLGKENFTKIMTTVAGISSPVDPSIADSKTAIIEGKIIKVDNSIFFNESSDAVIDSKNIKFSKDTYTSYPSSNSYSGITYSISKDNFLNVPYNQLVFVEFASEMNFNGVNHPKGDIILVPAIVAYALINNANTEQLQKTTWLVVDGVLFATGVGEVKIFFTAGNWARKIIVGADILGSGVNLLLDAGLEQNLPPDIARKCRVAGLLLSIPNGLLALKDIGGPLVKEFRAAKAELKSAEQAQEFEKRIVAFEKQIDAASSLAQIEKIAEKIPENLRKQFIADFGNSSDEIIKALSKENSELINGWKKFRKNNPTTILCH